MLTGEEAAERAPLAFVGLAVLLGALLLVVRVRVREPDAEPEAHSQREEAKRGAGARPAIHENPSAEN